MQVLQITYELLQIATNTRQVHPSILSSSSIFVNFRRDTKDTEWIRILTLLDVGTEMYDTMTREDMDNKCPAKIICQAFESREIFGKI